LITDGLTIVCLWLGTVRVVPEAADRDAALLFLHGFIFLTDTKQVKMTAISSMGMKASCHQKWLVFSLAWHLRLRGFDSNCHSEAAEPLATDISDERDLR
jgi:hypothetical protein